MQCTCVIVGAGIVGSAIAYELSQRGMRDIHVVDPDLEGPLSSSERNAGGVRHLWQHQINFELAKASIAFFEKIESEIGFQQTGYLWLYESQKQSLAQSISQKMLERKIPYDVLAPREITNRYPFLDKLDNVGCALFGPKDGLINSNALKEYFRTQAKEKGVLFHDHTWVQTVGEKTLEISRCENQTIGQKYLQSPPTSPSTETWKSEIIILAAGAWSGYISPLPRIDPPIRPVRRQISYFSVDSFDMSPYGMVVDTSGVYFHPEGGNVLAGFVLPSEPAAIRFDADPGFFQDNIWPALYERSSHFERLREIRSWGGLYSYTPDATGILGKVPGHKSLYEAHSFTGRGVMQSYGAAIALADLILDNQFHSIDASCLSRERFSRGELLKETLHI